MKPLRYAVRLSLSYFVVAGSYILVSDRLAATIASDMAEFERIEHVKGILFVIVTGALLFFASWAIFRENMRQALDSARDLTRRMARAVSGHPRARAHGHEDHGGLAPMYRSFYGMLVLLYTCSRDPGIPTLMDKPRFA